MRILTAALVILLMSALSVATEPTGDSAGEVASSAITLKWSARSEASVYGYLVYRADRRQGPFLRINAEIIHAKPAGEDETINNYVYTDISAEPGTTYFYYLDTISKEGYKDRFSGVIKKSATAEPTAGPDAS